MDPVTICRRALGWIGANLITQLNEANPQSDEEAFCATNYPLAVLAALEEKAWLFATGSMPLDLGAPQETGDARFPVRFAVPPNVVAIRLCDDGSGDYRIEWERRGEWVVSEDTDHLYAIATVYVGDPKKWTPTFSRAVAARLAADGAPIFSPERAGLDKKMEARYTDALSKAGVFDGRQASGGRIGQAPSPMGRRGR